GASPTAPAARTAPPAGGLPATPPASAVETDAAGVGGFLRLHPDQRECEQNEDHEERQRDASIASGGARHGAPGALFDRFGVAQQHVADVVHAGLDPGRKVAAPERRENAVLDDESCHRIGQLGLEPAADLDANFALLRSDDEDDAVVLVLLADAPR